MLDRRYRVVRAEEYVAIDAHGGIETPRPTDPEPLTPDWSPGAGAGARSPRVDDGLVLDPGAPLAPLQAAERVALRSLAYSGTRFPGPMLADSARAVESRPDVLLTGRSETDERLRGLPPPGPRRRHSRPHPQMELRRRRRPRQPGQDLEEGDVWPASFELLRTRILTQS
ncbi:DUF5954 family protein [Streptomyces sp. NBC_00090]|uniref:DUF5954 family protein n=1 Tax=Streptomyces sp. NBC_00090 TaxID=2903619 RepID=UPI003864ABB5